MGDDEPSYAELDAAVAEVLRLSVTLGLPQRAVIGKGHVVVGRRTTRCRPGRRRYGPAHLFTINWADSAPGMERR